MQALFSLQLYYEKILAQESNLTIFKQRYFMKHVKPDILWSTPGTPFSEPCQARDFMNHAEHVNFFEARQAREQVKHAST